jgi:hypothetical protein
MGNRSPFLFNFLSFCSCVIHSIHQTLNGHDVNKNISAGPQLREDILSGRDVGGLEYRKIHNKCRKQYGRVDLAVHFRERP